MVARATTGQIPHATCIPYTLSGSFPSSSPFLIFHTPASSYIPPFLLLLSRLLSILSPLLIPFPALPFSLRTIYEKLGGAVSEEQCILYTQRVEEISPNVRYCAYNMGDTQTDITQIMKLAGDAPGYDMLASKIDVRIEHQCSSHHPWSYPSCSFQYTASNEEVKVKMAWVQDLYDLHVHRIYMCPCQARYNTCLSYWKVWCWGEAKCETQGTSKPP